MHIVFFSVAALAIFFFLLASKSILSGILLFIWCILISIAAIGNVFIETPIFLPVTLIATALLTLILYLRLKTDKIDYRFFLWIHILRIPVEAVLFGLYLKHKVPLQMTYLGWNFDILFGITAVILLAVQILCKKRSFINLRIIWNILGIISLLTILSIGILSSPIPLQRIAFEQPNIAVLEFPFVLLPTIIVPIVMLSHFLTLKHLFSRSKNDEKNALRGA
ncbi:hypothetical protein [Sphingobacterium sp. LRF_L2]|uniref:hypothetical protein n=1 Tax=Sphingobacterium sp. LRF_L2 TaxID=3369421 RepID=UPI003F63F7D2